jgi:hypothetical protein
MNSIKERALKAINLEQFNQFNEPEILGELDLTPPSERQYVLRCLIKRPFSEIKLPHSLSWCEPMVNACFKKQQEMGITQPFCYITVRHGIVTTKTDDEWHVDGFSMTITHLPEQNYSWCSEDGTEFINKAIEIPKDFNPLLYNIHSFIQDSITPEDKIKSFKPKTIYCFDPYVIHRRPITASGKLRTFVRLSFTPIEINDINNTFNHSLVTNYTRDGKKDFRNKLVRYPK